MAPEPVVASVHVDAEPGRVYEYFTAPEAMVRWMGNFARLDATPGGEFAVDIEGVPVRGHYVELDPPHRLLIAWGHAGSERLPPGGSTLEVKLVPDAGGTRVEIVHSGLPEPEATGHPAGWRRYLDRLAVAAATR
jgi:uncharacterized protein YndB with AHSA1/START domain